MFLKRLWSVSCALWLNFGAVSCSESDKASPGRVSISTLREAAPSPGQEPQFGLRALAFVTPWNSEGYDNAVYFASKFEWISPVWFHVERDASDAIVLQGKQDVNQAWISKLRDASPGNGKPYIVPRLVFPSLRVENYEDFNTIGKLVGEAALEYGLDGATIEMPWMHSAPVMKNILQRIRFDARRVKPGFQVVLVFPKPTWRKAGVITGEKDKFTAQTMLDVLTTVDAAMLMTYDFHHLDQRKPPNETPLAPMIWIEETFDAVDIFADASKEPREEIMSKLLLGVPLYGYGPSGAITSRDLIELHEEDGGETMGEEFEWDVKVQEHYWKCVDGDVRFPTPQFLVRRFEEARKRGVGVAFWELGQNFPHVLDYL